MKFGRAAAMRCTTFFDIALFVPDSPPADSCFWRVSFTAGHGVEGYRLHESETSAQDNNRQRHLVDCRLQNGSDARSVGDCASLPG
jgi:hypothetical protein